MNSDEQTESDEDSNATYSSIATGNARISLVAHGPSLGAPTKRVDFSPSTPRRRAVTILSLNVPYPSLMLLSREL
jgi:hypothetical protein